MVKKTKNPVADDKNCQIFSRHVQKPTTLKSNRDIMFTEKPNSLSLIRSENYSFGASFDKISSNNDKIYPPKFSNSLGVSKPPKNCVVGKKTKVGA